MLALILDYLAFAVSAMENGQACRNKNQNVMGAIERFCSKKDLVAPSSYSKAGTWSVDYHTLVRIEVECYPAQWV